MSRPRPLCGPAHRHGLAVKTIENDLYRLGYSSDRITVIGIDDDWRDEPPKLNTRVGTLMYPNRTIVLSPKSVPPEYRKLFKGYKA